MNGDVIDVAIGVVFVWFLLSVLVSAINEGFALITHVRAKHLWLGIGRLIDPRQSPLPRRFVDSSINLPFRSRGDLRPTAAPEPGEPPARPSWWVRLVGMFGLFERFTARPEKVQGELEPLRVRAQALYDELAPQVTEIAKGGRLSKITHVGSDVMADAVISLARNVHPDDLRATAVELGWDDAARGALDQALADTDDAARLDSDDLAGLAQSAAAEGLSVDQARELYAAAAKRLTVRDVSDYFADNPELGKAVRRAATAVGLDEKTAAVKQAIETAFDRSMDQMTRFYRRQNRKILAVVAIPIVLVLQTNSIGIARNLWHDKNLRVATASAGANELGTDALREACANAGSGAAAGSSDLDQLVAEASDRYDCAADVIGRASQFRVGFALDELKAAHGATGSAARFEMADIVPFLAKDYSLVGRILTWMALLFGAQFWFDILRRMVGLRKLVGGAAAPLTT
jgi:hypothetical protein